MIRLLSFRFQFTGFLFAAAALIGVISSAADRPNILFVFSDQQSFDMLGCAGNSQIKTPNLDALARQGFELARQEDKPWAWNYFAAAQCKHIKCTDCATC